MNIRLWKYSDTLDVSKIENECFSHPWTYEMLAESFIQDNFLGYVAEYDGKVVGYIALTYCFDEAELNLIAVTSNLRNKKIATTLIERAETELAKKGVKKIFLEVRRSNEVAQALYEKLGFTYVSVRKNYYEGVEDALIMTKLL